MHKEMLTSAAANKLLRQLQDDKAYLIECENNSDTYIHVDGHEDVVPNYDYSQTRKEIAAIDDDICHLKHAINVFNCTTKLPDSDITIDIALVKMAQLTREKDKLDRMRKRLPLTRNKSRYGDTSQLVEYVCANYDIAQAKEDYNKICAEIRALQIGIDYVNQTEKFEVSIR